MAFNATLNIHLPDRNFLISEIHFRYIHLNLSSISVYESSPILGYDCAFHLFLVANLKRCMQIVIVHIQKPKMSQWH